MRATWRGKHTSFNVLDTRRSLAANASDVVAVLRDELRFDTKQVNAIVNVARASGESMGLSC